MNPRKLFAIALIAVTLVALGGAATKLVARQATPQISHIENDLIMIIHFYKWIGPPRLGAWSTIRI